MWFDILNNKLRVGSSVILAMMVVFSGVLLTGCIGEDDFEIREFTFAESVDGDDVEEREDNEYNLNETVLIYFEVWGLEVEDDEANVSQTISIMNQEDEVIWETPVHLEPIEMNDADYLIMDHDGNEIDTDNIPLEYRPEEGSSMEYTIEVEITDQHAEETITHTEEFILNR